MLFLVAKQIVPSGESEILASFEAKLNWEKPCSPDVVAVYPNSDPAEYGRNLTAAVQLCHDSLGFEHDQFSILKRRALYDRWCRANSQSMMLLKPSFGMARGQAVGVTIILPLNAEGLSHIQAKDGGVLKLDERHILRPGRLARCLLIDTLLLKDEWIKIYGPTALRALFHHVASFYNPRTWRSTELYCTMYQGGLVGKYLPGMRSLIRKRGFKSSDERRKGRLSFDYVFARWKPTPSQMVSTKGTCPSSKGVATQVIRRRDQSPDQKSR